MSGKIDDAAAITAKVQGAPAEHERQIQEVVRQAAQGDPSAFATLYEHYHDYVRNTAFHVLHQHEDAEDVAQDVWRKLLLHLEKYPHEVRFSTWLYRVVCNAAIDHTRRSHINRQVPADTSDEHQAVALEEQASRHNSVPDQEIDFLQTRIREELERGLEQLKIQHPRRAQCFDLHYLEEKSVGEIASETHLSEGTVKSHLFYARRYFQQAHSLLFDLYFALQEKLGKSMQ
jgi:RNA polymerase sigma-70 factor (ECF subfamily)